MSRKDLMRIVNTARSKKRKRGPNTSSVRVFQGFQFQHSSSVFVSETQPHALFGTFAAGFISTLPKHGHFEDEKYVSRKRVIKRLHNDGPEFARRVTGQSRVHIKALVLTLFFSFVVQ